MPDRLKIPYEKGNDISNSEWTPAVHFFKQNRQYQMRYTKKAVESGTYREWITQVSDQELEDFIKQNTKKLQSGIEHKLMGPSFRIRYYWRNTMYELELLYRQYGPELSEEVLEKWADDMMADLSYWEGKYAVARSEWQKENDVTAEENASIVTPYY